jgi:integrase
MENKPLVIPKSKKWPGVRVVCLECGTLVYDVCKKTGKPLAQCPHGDRHRFKLIEYIPGEKSQRVTKNLETRDMDEAIGEAIKLRREVKSGVYQSSRKKDQKQEESKMDQIPNIPFLLKNAMPRYVGWLRNEEVPAHLVKTRTPEHVSDVDRALAFWTKCIAKNGYHEETTTVEDINNKMVGLVFQALENRGFAPRTFNKYMSYYTSFLTWYTEEFDILIKNYFEKVKRKNLNPRPEAITFKEYKALLARITPENGIKEYKDGVKPTRNLYRPWLANGIRLALETGRRREEIINLKWKDIEESNGYLYIKVEDFKVNRIQQRNTEEEKKYIYIPVTDSLSKLLDELGYHIYIGMENFILAPELKMSRGRVMSDVLSRGFTHFYGQLGTGRKLTFKCLRKTYITNLEIFMGRGNTKLITGHSNDQVIERNYVDKKEVARAAHGFAVFSDEYERNQELQEIRTTMKREKEPENPER